MHSLRNKWTALCEALGPTSTPSLNAPAPPIWISGVQYSGDISPRDRAAVGLDDYDHFPSMSSPPKVVSLDSSSSSTTTTSSSAVPPPGTVSTTSSSSALASSAPVPGDQPIIKFIDVAHCTMWCSYRSHFSPLARHNLTNDAGWGCMLRSGQMLLCNALMEHCLGRYWRIHARLPEHDPGKHSAVVDAVQTIIPDTGISKSVIRLFLDHPDSPFGVHMITKLGAQYGVRPGDWFAPTPISLVMRDLCMRFQPAGFRAYCARDGTIYLDELRTMLGTMPPDKMSNAVEDACMIASKGVVQTPQAASEAPSGFLIMIPVRLGINSLSEAYYPAIHELFHEPCFVGIVGGRPHSSLFFFASQGRYLYYLNPHYVQTTEPHPTSTGMISISSYIPTRVRKVPVSELDPSMSLGFLFGSMAEFTEFQRRFTQNPVINDLFSILPSSTSSANIVEADSFSKLVDI